MILYSLPFVITRVLLMIGIEFAVFAEEIIKRYSHIRLFFFFFKTLSEYLENEFELIGSGWKKLKIQIYIFRFKMFLYGFRC